MKKSILLLMSMLLILHTRMAFAKIWRVNNSAGVTADFTTLQDAHDGASSGDTIHVEGSGTNYGSLTSTKKLVIIGPGYYLEENQNLQAHPLTAKVSTVTLNSGSEGFVLMGLDFGSSPIQIFADNITIRRNRFATANGQQYPEWTTGIILLYYHSDNSSIPVSNILITQNYGVRIESRNASTGVLIANNYIAYGDNAGDDVTADALNLSTGTVAIIQNNIFRRGKITAHNSTFTNNIMVAGTLEGTGNMIANNIGSNTQFGTTNGNKSNVSMSTVFVGAGEGASTDGRWKLKAGSPAIGAGFGSTAANPVDAGMFSGHSPYVLSGIPPVPTIYFFESQPVGSDADPIEVTVKVRSNN